MNAEPGHPHFTPRETHRQSRLQVQCGHPRVILSFEKKNNLDQHFIASLTVCCAPEHADVTQWVSAAHNGCDSSTSRRVRSQQTLHTFSIKETNRSLAFSAHGTRPQLRRQSRNPKNYSLARIFFFGASTSSSVVAETSVPLQFADRVKKEMTAQRLRTNGTGNGWAAFGGIQKKHEP